MVLAAKWLDSVLEPPTDQGFMLARVSRMAARAYSAALLLTALELSANALRQYPVLNPAWFWLTWLSVVVPIGGMFISAYFFEEHRIWYALHALGVLFTLITWPFQAKNWTSPADDNPWIWWSLGMAAMSAGFGFRRWLAWIFIAGLPFYWLVLHTTEPGGSSTVLLASEDAIYTGLFSAVFTSLIFILKDKAREADEVMGIAAVQAIETATRSAVGRERIRTATELHNKVLMTLEQAIEQRTPAQAEQVAEAAQLAIHSLRNRHELLEDWSSNLDASSVFEAIADAVLGHTDMFQISGTQTGECAVPGQVARALTEATLQAVSNALTHSKARNFELRMNASSTGVKLVIRDDGVGFYQRKVSPSSLGISKIIREGMESVGGSAHVQSRPEIRGTQVILEWANA